MKTHKWWVLKNWRIDSKRNGFPYVCLRCCRLGDLHKAGGCLQATGFHTRMLHNHSPDLCRQASSQPAFGGTSKWLHQALQCDIWMDGVQNLAAGWLSNTDPHSTIWLHVWAKNKRSWTTPRAGDVGRTYQSYWKFFICTMSLTCTRS